MTDTNKWVKFECHHCAVLLEARLTAAGRSRRCPGCRQQVLVPLPLHDFPTPMPHDGAANYISHGQQILAATQTNCDLCRRASNREAFHQCRKDGKRALKIVHSFLMQLATDRDFRMPVVDSADSLVHPAAVTGPSIIMDAKTRKTHGAWLESQRKKEQFERYEAALTSIREYQQLIEAFCFREA